MESIMKLIIFSGKVESNLTNGIKNNNTGQAMSFFNTKEGCIDFKSEKW